MVSGCFGSEVHRGYDGKVVLAEVVADLAYGILLVEQDYRLMNLPV